MRGKTLRPSLASALPIRASMRPRIYAGKDQAFQARQPAAAGASMRPRIYAGKDTDISIVWTRIDQCFNEAPHLCGERPLTERSADASIRRFNEAPHLCGERRAAG